VAISLPLHGIASADFVSLATTQEEIAELVPKRKRGISLLAITRGNSNQSPLCGF